MLHVKRFLVYILGLIVLALGVAFSIRSGLGVTPVSSLPYTFSRITGLTVGLTTTIFYAFCVLLQGVILRKDFKVRYLLQLFLAYVFGLFTDMSLFLTRNLIVDSYLLRLLLLAISLVLIGFGVYTVILTDVVMNAPDGLVKAVSDYWHLEFPRVKSIFDILCVSTSVLLSLIFIGSIPGLREGTVISALSIGKIIGFISRRYRSRIMALYT